MGVVVVVVVSRWLNRGQHQRVKAFFGPSVWEPICFCGKYSLLVTYCWLWHSVKELFSCQVIIKPHLCVCACVCVCVRASVRASGNIKPHLCVCVCVRACVRVWGNHEASPVCMRVSGNNQAFSQGEQSTCWTGRDQNFRHGQLTLYWRPWSAWHISVSICQILKCSHCSVAVSYTHLTLPTTPYV